MRAVSAERGDGEANLPEQARSKLQGGSEFHPEPPRQVLVGQEGEGAAVDAVLSERLEQELMIYSFG